MDRAGRTGARGHVLPRMLCSDPISVPYPALGAIFWAGDYFSRGSLLSVNMLKVKPGVASDFMVNRMVKIVNVKIIVRVYIVNASLG